MTNALIAFEGDSRSVDTKLWAGRAVDYCSNQYGIEFNYLNNAVGGSTIGNMVDRASALDAEILADVANILVVWIGVNSSGQTSSDLHTNISNYCSARQTAGWYVALCTEIDAQDGIRDTDSWHTKYLELNTLIRANYTDYADVLVDLGAVTQLQDATNTDWFTDSVHLTSEGYYAVQTEVLAVLAGGTPAHLSLSLRLAEIGTIIDNTTF